VVKLANQATTLVYWSWSVTASGWFVRSLTAVANTIREDIPVMLIEEGDKWTSTPVEELPEPGSLV